MSHPLRVAHLNTRASPTSWTLAEIAAERNEVDVFLIQDPPRDMKSHLWANFSLVLPREINPLVAVLIRKGIKFRLGGGEGARVLWTAL